MSNKFEFVVVAGARAKQLLRGCVPKVEASGKPARLAHEGSRSSGKIERAGRSPSDSE